MKNYGQDYFKSLHPNPMQNYYANTTQDPKQMAQIKRVKSSQNLPLMPSSKQFAYQKNYEKPIDKKQNKSKEKIAFIEPGKQINQLFEEIISTTSTTQNGITTYFIAKALKGPLLSYASQQCNKKQPSKKPNKKIPQIPQSICGTLEPHLEGYSTLTHEGLYRSTNQDKITIYLQQNSKWFSIYDGHGGNMCSQFLKDHLHEYFFKQDWKKDIPNSLRKAFLTAQEEWKKKGDNSGSCALVVFIHDNVCYAANLGDSRAVLCSENNQKCYQITKDHKPSNIEEQKRIISAGGKIYQTTAITQTQSHMFDMIVGPLRVFPGRLSTTRTFGDFQAKQSTSKVVICEPEITSFDINEHDLIVMGSDGLWDRIQNKQAVEIMKKIHENGLKGQEWYKKGSECLLEEAMCRGSTDNISIILIGLNDPQVRRQPKKGNENIKIMSSISSNQLASRKRQTQNDKQNFPEKMKELDNKISEINRNASRVLQQSRRS